MGVALLNTFNVYILYYYYISKNKESILPNRFVIGGIKAFPYLLCNDLVPTTSHHMSFVDVEAATYSILNDLSTTASHHMLMVFVDGGAASCTRP